MNSKHERTFCPRLEAFEDRNLPSMLSSFFSGLFGGGSSAAAPASNSNLSSGLPLTLTGKSAAMQALDGLTHPTISPLSPPSSSGSGGSSVVVTTSNSSSQVSSGASSATSVAATTNTLTLNPDGTISGSFFGTSASQTSTTSATAGTAAAVPSVVSTVGGSAQSFSLVPDSTSFGLTDPVSSVTTTSTADPGLTTPGLITPASLRSDPGLNIPV